MVFLVRGRGAENIEKRRKQTEEKHRKKERKKTEEHRKRQIITINIFGVTFYIKNYIILYGFTKIWFTSSWVRSHHM